MVKSNNWNWHSGTDYCDVCGEEVHEWVSFEFDDAQEVYCLNICSPCVQAAVKFFEPKKEAPEGATSEAPSKDSGHV